MPAIEESWGPTGWIYLQRPWRGGLKTVRKIGSWTANVGMYSDEKWEFTPFSQIMFGFRLTKIGIWHDLTWHYLPSRSGVSWNWGNPNIIQNWSKIGHCEQGNQVGSGCALFWFILRVPKCSETSAWRSGNLGIQRDPNCAQRMLFFRICVGYMRNTGCFLGWTYPGRGSHCSIQIPTQFIEISEKILEYYGKLIFSLNLLHFSDQGSHWARHTSLKVTE